MLRVGGALVTVTTSHVRGGSVAFFEQAQRCYERWDPDTPPGLRLRPAHEVPPDLDEVDTSPLFAGAVRRRFCQDVHYSSSGYLQVLATYSNHRALTETQRQGLFACLADLADREHAGRITKRYLYEVRVAVRQAGP